MPLVSWGPYVFSSGYNPTEIRGPDKQTFLVEHEIPAREGGIVEYVGSKQVTYEFRGFISPPQDGTFNGVAAAYLSGNGYIGVNADDAKAVLLAARGSGAQLLKIESTNTNFSGYSVMYEENFFHIDKATFAYEGGKTYPYYPYNLSFKGASTKTFGNSSGVGVTTTTVSPFSGYIWAMVWRSGFYTGGPVISLGFYVASVASGSARMAIYNASGPQGTTYDLIAESPSQAVHSGWNYFPINPTLKSMASGNFYFLAIQTNVANTSGWSYLTQATTITSGTISLQSGVAYGAFPDPFAPGTLDRVSGTQINLVMVTA